MSEPLTREQIIEQVRNALHDTACYEQCDSAAMDLQTRQAERVLPVITRAITDRVRALHGPSPHSLVRCACGVVEPCPTVRELDAIDSEMGVQR